MRTDTSKQADITNIMVEFVYEVGPLNRFDMAIVLNKS